VIVAQLLDALRVAGYVVQHWAADSVERIYRWDASTSSLRLVGMLIVRDGRPVYAELRRRLFVWWRPAESDVDGQAAELLEWIRANPA
jgi:hypothetical protein